MATVSSALPDRLELDSLECNSTFRELIPKFEGGGQNRQAVTAIFRMRDMIH